MLLLPTRIAETRLQALGDLQVVSFTDGRQGYAAVKTISYTPAAAATQHSPAEEAQVEFEAVAFAVFSDNSQEQAYFSGEITCDADRLAISQDSLDDIEIAVLEQAKAQAQSDYESRFEAADAA